MVKHCAACNIATEHRVGTQGLKCILCAIMRMRWLR